MRAACLGAFALAACAVADGSGSGSQGSTDGGVVRLLQIHVVSGGTVQGAAFNCRADCQEKLADGQAVHLDAVVDPGWKFDGWQGDCTGTGGCDLTMSADRSITASFSTLPPPPPGTVRVDVVETGTGSGRVTSVPAGIDCPGACSMAVASGTAVTLSPQAAAGSSFAGFGGACSGPGCSFTASADSIAWANFAANPPPPPARRTLTVTLDGEGRVTSSPAGLECTSASCSAQFDSGASVSLIEAAAMRWGFAGWSGACSGASDCTVKLDQDALVTAHFSAPPPPPSTAHVIVTVNGRGQVTGSGINCGSGASTCDATFPGGATVTLNQTAANQARFSAWGGPCMGAGASCSFTANGEVRVTATFQDVLTTLVANDGTNQPPFAINSADVFYARYSSAAGGSIWAVPKNGGQPRSVASGMANWMVADDAYVYWTDMFAVYSAPVQGGAASQIFSSSSGITRLALDAEGALYFTATNMRSNGGEVHRLQNRGDLLLASGLNVHPGVAVDDAYVYFGNNEGAGALKRVPKLGGATQTVAACTGSSNCFLTSIKADAGNIYVRNEQGQAWRVRKGASTFDLLSGPNGGGGYFYWNEIDAWGSVVYWNFVYASSGVNGIFAANADASQWRAVDSSSDWQWFGPRVDDAAIYYWHQGSLLRRLK